MPLPSKARMRVASILAPTDPEREGRLPPRPEFLVSGPYRASFRYLIRWGSKGFRPSTSFR
jgi:hypothetical protein